MISFAKEKISIRVAFWIAATMLFSGAAAQEAGGGGSLIWCLKKWW